MHIQSHTDDQQAKIDVGTSTTTVPAQKLCILALVWITATIAAVVKATVKPFIANAD